jgi:hypothetical protein
VTRVPGKHKHLWIYYGGMATCACGLELLSNGTTRRPPQRRWKKHRDGIGQRRYR